MLAVQERDVRLTWEAGMHGLRGRLENLVTQYVSLSSNANEGSESACLCTAACTFTEPRNVRSLTMVTHSFVRPYDPALHTPSDTTRIYILILLSVPASLHFSWYISCVHQRKEAEPNLSQNGLVGPLL